MIPMNNHIDFAAINRAALASLPALLSTWLPGGKQAGPEYSALNPNRNDRKLGSFSINTNTGRWSDFATGDEGGDPVSLLAFLSGTSQAEAARELATMLGMPGEERKGIRHQDTREFERRRHQAQERQRQRGQEQRAEDARKTQYALGIWRDARPAKGSLVETYLRARGINIEPPLSLKYAPSLKHKGTELHLPAMVAPVQNVAGNIVGAHRTYLAQDGRRKASVSDNKMMIGHCAGGAVRLAATAPAWRILYTKVPAKTTCRPR
jgi:hypothetical protein